MITNKNAEDVEWNIKKIITLNEYSFNNKHETIKVKQDWILREDVTSAMIQRLA